jgi:hypothetical protein
MPITAGAVSLLRPEEHLDCLLYSPKLRAPMRPSRGQLFRDGRSPPSNAIVNFGYHEFKVVRRSPLVKVTGRDTVAGSQRRMK